jgi:hypothetical protein
VDRACAPQSGLDAGEVALSGGKEFFALAGSFGGKIGVAADHKVLAGEVGCGDGGHVALIEQREMQGRVAAHVFIAVARSEEIQSRRADLISG